MMWPTASTALFTDVPQFFFCLSTRALLLSPSARGDFADRCPACRRSGYSPNNVPPLLILAQVEAFFFFFGLGFWFLGFFFFFFFLFCVVVLGILARIILSWRPLSRI